MRPRLNPDSSFLISYAALDRLSTEAEARDTTYRQRFRDRLYMLAGLRHQARAGRINAFPPTFSVSESARNFTLRIGLADPMFEDFQRIAYDLGIPFEEMAEHVICWVLKETN